MKRSGSTIIKSCLFILILVCLSIPALPASAASGISVGPTNIDITDAMRGSRYQNQISIFNGGDEPMEYKIRLEDEAASWIYVSYKGQEVTSLTVSAATREYVDVTTTIPMDTANGDYTAKIIVTSVASASGPGQAVALEAYSRINVSVSGTQNLAGKVNAVTVKDQESGFPVLFQVYFENTGNVLISPSIDVAVNWEDTAVDSFTYQDTSFEPAQKGFIDINWDTTGRTPGNYTALVTIKLENEEIYTQDLSFQILSLGSLTRSGELSQMTIDGTMQPGKIAKVNAIFSNTGEADVLARLIGEIYYNGDLLDTLQGDSLMINRGTQGTLSAYFTPVEEGTYTIKGQIDFGGKKTDIKEISFDITSADHTTNPESSAVTGSAEEDVSTTSSNPWPIIGGIAGGLMILGIGVVLWRKR